MSAGSIWAASLVHGTVDNASRAGSYWVVVVDQYGADIGVALSMVVVVALLGVAGELRRFRTFFADRVQGGEIALPAVT